MLATVVAFIGAHWALFSGGGASLLFAVVAGIWRAVSPTTLITHWKAVVGLVVAVLVVIALLWLWLLLEHARVALADRNAAYEKLNGNYQITLNENKTLSASNRNLGLVIQTQSKSIDVVASQGQAQKAAAADALAAVIAKQADDRKTIAKLTARIADPSNQGSCDNEISVLRAGL